MKKLLSFAFVVALTTTMQAASINWSITGNTTAVVKDYLGEAYASKTVYLIAASDLSSITSTEQSVTDFTSALDALTLTTTASSATGAKPSVSGQVVSDGRLTAGTSFTFGLLIVSEDSEGNGFFKVLSVPGTPYADGAPASDQTKLQTAWVGLNNQSWVQGYGVSTPSVPEPATGALALAGVALLFKRRKV